MGSLVSVTELKESRSGSGNIETGSQEGRSVYRVKWSDTTAFAYEIVAASGVPIWGAQLGSTKMYVTEKSAKPIKGDQTSWDVDVSYRTLDPNKAQPKLNATDTTWGVVKQIRGYPLEEPIQKDRDGKICVNVVNEPFNPPMTQVLYDQQIDINFLTTASSHAYNILLTLGKLNAATATLTIGAVAYVIPAAELKFFNFSATEQYDQDGNRITSYTENFLWRFGGWVENRPNFSLLHRDTAIDGGTTNRSIARNMIGAGTTSEPTTEPWYLDAAGQQIEFGATIVNNSFNNFTTASFTDLLSAISG